MFLGGARWGGRGRRLRLDRCTEEEVEEVAQHLGRFGMEVGAG